MNSSHISGHKQRHLNTGQEVKEKSADYITREGVFRHMWMDIKLTGLHKCYIYSHFPNLWELYACIREFLEMFSRKRCDTSLFENLLEKYKKKQYKRITKFCILNLWV